MSFNPLRPSAPWIAILLCGAFAVIAAPVEISHPVYGFLRRMEMEAKVAPGHLGTLPLSKAQVGRLLEEAHSHGHALQAWERTRLHSYREEFGLIEGAGGRYRRLEYRDSTFQVGGSAESFNGGYVQDSLPRAMTNGFGYISGTVEGTYREKIHFTSSAGIGQERSLHERLSENYDPRRGMPYNTDRAGKAGAPRTVGTFDAFRTIIGYEDQDFRLDFGTDWNQWGPGIWQHAFLSQRSWFWVQDSLPASDSVLFPGTLFPGRHRRGFRRPGEAAPMTQVRLAVRLGRFTYTKVVAERTGLYKDSLAHLVAHRLEFRPWRFLGLGIQEMALTAGRPMDWTYVIPLVPIKYTEHQLGDRDNIGIGLDAEVLLAGWRAYGELLLDDFSGWDLDFWGAKYAYTLGFETAGLPLRASRIQFEYAHVEPWVFTHRLPDQQMIHFGSLVGSSLPANSHAFRGAVEHVLRSDLDLRVEYAFMQRDATSRGSSVFDVHDNATDGTQKRFLGGTVETRHAVQAGVTWRWKRFVELNGAIGYLHVSDWKSRPGETLSSPILSGELTLRY